MVFIETTVFTKHLSAYLTDDEYLGLQNLLLRFPETGKPVPGSGGVRKLRWGTKGRGKRGGIRVIYYLKRIDDAIWLLTLYHKNETVTLPAHVLKQIAPETEHAK